MNTEVYTIQSGDTLGAIANRKGIDLQGLLDLNPQIANQDLIVVGQHINVPASGAPATAPLPAGSPASDSPWYPIALAELDVEEIAGSAHNPRILEYHATTSLRATDDETPWCSSFVNWCVRRAGHNGTDSAAARSWLRWGRPLATPSTGCIVVLSRGSNPASGHVGFYEGETGSHVRVLGGNQSNAVNVSSYPKSRLLGYRSVAV